MTIYLPMIPEAAIAMLACARIGAAHTVVFGGFSADSLRERIADSRSKLLITADGGWRRGNGVPLKDAADAALEGETTIEKVIVFNRTDDPKHVPMQQGRDLWWHRLMEEASAKHDAPPMDAEDPLYILYTSGSTGKPKGILHTTGGYLTGVATTTKDIFDMKDSDVYWCTADVGWVTGHSYVVYGPLANGATVFMYEGAPDWPQRDRFWALIEKYGITVLYTAPTAIRAFMKWGTEWPEKHDLSSLRLLGSVGEPINPEAWLWYHTHIGGGRCPIVDTWWQTETGAIMITPLPGLTTTKPASASRPFPGISAEVVDEQGQPSRRARIRPAFWSSPSRGRPCCGRSGAMTSVTEGLLEQVRRRRAITSPATARGGTKKAITGCWAAWTTSCWSPATTSPRWRSSRPWWTIPPSRRRPSSGARTRSRARPSPRS